MGIEQVLQKAMAMGYTVERDVSMRRLTTFRIGGPAQAVVSVDHPGELPAFLRECVRCGVPWRVIGNGSNLLVNDGGLTGVVIRLTGERICFDGETLRCDAGILLHRLCVEACAHGLAGLSFGYGIPGSVGGAVVMNAGAYGGDMASVVVSVEAVSAQGVTHMRGGELAFGYRHSIFSPPCDRVITAVTMRLRAGDRNEIDAAMKDCMQKRRSRQPLAFPSAGSYFKRPPGHFAGALIEQCGLKGFRVGDAQVSEQHAGFVINMGNATCDDVCALEREIQQKVFTRTGIMLEREVVLM